MNSEALLRSPADHTLSRHVGEPWPDSGRQPGDGEVVWVWPAIAYLDDPTESDWQALLPLYTQGEIDEIRAGGEGYGGGFHLWIAVDGTWSGAAIMSV